MTAPFDAAHDRWDELAAGYALHALEPAEEAELLTHLNGCATCRDGLRDHEFVAGELAALADDADVAPPSWTSIRGAIVGDSAATSSSPDIVVDLDAPRPSPDTVVDLAERRTRRRQYTLVGAAAAAAAVLVAGVVTATQIGGGPSATQQAVSACRSSAACHVVELARGSHERAFVLVRDGHAQLLPTDLPSPGASSVYALWQLPRAGKPTLLAQPVSPADTSSAPLALAYDDTAAFALSVEPAGAPATSPTTVVAVGTASA